MSSNQSKKQSKKQAKQRSEHVHKERPNKSQQKRDMAALGKMSEFICDLKPKQLESLSLETELLNSIHELKRIKSPNARNRHMLFVTRLLVEQKNIEHIKSQVHQLQNPHLLHQKRDIKIEKLLEGIYQQSQPIIDELLDNPISGDRQNFLQLIRNAQKEHQDAIEKQTEDNEKTAQAQGKHIKKLKKRLREMLSLEHTKNQEQ